MPISIWDAGGVLREATRLSLWDGARLVPAKILKAMDDTATLRTVGTFAGTLAATIIPSPVTRTVVGAPGSSVTTGLVTATPTGGLTPYTYAWTCTSHSNPTAPSIAAPSNASTTFTQTDADFTNTATFQCVVTDFSGASVSVSVNATFNLVS